MSMASARQDSDGRFLSRTAHRTGNQARDLDMALWEIAPLKSLHVNWQSHAPTPMVEHSCPASLPGPRARRRVSLRRPEAAASAPARASAMAYPVRGEQAVREALRSAG